MTWNLQSKGVHSCACHEAMCRNDVQAAYILSLGTRWNSEWSASNPSQFSSVERASCTDAWLILSRYFAEKKNFFPPAHESNCISGLSEM